MSFKIRKIKQNNQSLRAKLKQLFGGIPVVYAKIIKIAGLTVITVVLMVLVYLGEQAGIWFKASVLEAPMPFNGTALPVDKVPNWTKVGGKTTLKYDQFQQNDFIDIPKYDTGTLEFPDDNLIWGNSSHDNIRNVKITYAVVYLGNYKLDHKENIGSHLAIDIKMPEGTPVKAIANGKVIKMSMQSDGFGHHVVIKHPDAPDPANPAKSAILYSSFNHMGRIDVIEGENVLKGQIIGTSGNTGTSTTPHLHFQIDRDSAPWHPYWPFTWQESQGAGLSFTEAVNAGLGLSNGKTHTINPMDFVYKNLNYSAVASADNAVINKPDSKESATGSNESQPLPLGQITVNRESTIENRETAKAAETATFTQGSASKLFSYKITGETLSYINNGVTLEVTDGSGQISRLNDNETVDIELTGVGQLLKKQFKKSDFIDNSIKVIVKSSAVGTSNITVGKTSYQVSFIDKVKPAAKFLIRHDGYFQKDIVENIEVVALDEDGNVAPAVNFMGTVKVRADIVGSARVIPNQIESGDFKNGIAGIRVIISHKGPVTFKAQNGALVGESDPIYIEDSAIFTDITRNHKNYEAIKYLKNNDIISGYSDGSFKPEKTVNRAEALKMLMLAFNVDVSGSANLNFSDVNKNAWYAETLSTALERGIVKGYSDGTFKPDKTVNRAEYLKILFETNNIKPNTDIVKPYNDVYLTDWFAGYAFLANKMNILDTSNSLYPTNGMTRADVAETIYRMKTIRDNNLVTYSR